MPFSVPPITLFLTLTSALLLLLVHLDTIPFYEASLPLYAFHNKTIFHFLFYTFYFGEPDLNTFIEIFFFLSYSSKLEEECRYELILIIATSCLLVILLGPCCGVFLVAPVISVVIVYVWTRRHSDVFINTLRISSFYLVGLLFVLGYLLTGGVPYNELLGVFIGCFYELLKMLLTSEKLLGVVKMIYKKNLKKNAVEEKEEGGKIELYEAIE